MEFNLNDKEVASPANAPARKTAAHSRIPMSVPQLKLAIPEIPGYHLHWMDGNPNRIQSALRAGYTFVEADEVDIAPTGLADDASKSGNTDMGTRISVSAGNSLDEAGNAQRLYLMKLPLEYWEADQKALEDRNENIAAVLRGGAVPGVENEGTEYIPDAHKKSVGSLFTRKRR